MPGSCALTMRSKQLQLSMWNSPRGRGSSCSLVDSTITSSRERHCGLTRQPRQGDSGTRLRSQVNTERQNPSVMDVLKRSAAISSCHPVACHATMTARAEHQHRSCSVHGTLVENGKIPSAVSHQQHPSQPGCFGPIQGRQSTTPKTCL